jgi:hypothetical protein
MHLTGDFMGLEKKKLSSSKLSKTPFFDVFGLLFNPIGFMMKSPATSSSSPINLMILFCV